MFVTYSPRADALLNLNKYSNKLFLTAFYSLCITNTQITILIFSLLYTIEWVKIK